MAEDTGRSESVESMAFQILLQKVTSLERAVQSLPPLLAKIISQLEAQQPRTDIPIATYAQLYPELDEETPGVDEPPPSVEVPSARPRPHDRLWRWFVKEPA